MILFIPPVRTYLLEQAGIPTFSGFDGDDTATAAVLLNDAEIDAESNITADDNMASAYWIDNNDDRPTYSLQQVDEGVLGDTITFNSIQIKDSDSEWYERTHNNEPIPTDMLRDETKFIGAREDTGFNDGINNIWEDTEIIAENDKTYIVRLYIHNNNPDATAAVAEETKVRFHIPYAVSSEITVEGYLASSNATPLGYMDGITFKSIDGSAFHLEYVPGSARLRNGGFASGEGIPLPDSITNQGNPTGDVEGEWTMIGYNGLDGRIPGGDQFDGFVTIQVKAVFDYEFLIETEVRLAGSEDKTWYSAVEAQVGDKVEFLIGYYNTSDFSETNVAIRDILPPNLRYIEGSTKLMNSNYVNGVTMNSDSLTEGGIRIGSYGPGANAYIMFTAEVVNDNMSGGAYLLNNWAHGSIGYTIVEDCAVVRVVYENE